MKVRLLDIAHARSGDKGDDANVGVIALREAWYPVLARYLTADVVRTKLKSDGHTYASNQVAAALKSLHIAAKDGIQHQASPA